MRIFALAALAAATLMSAAPAMASSDTTNVQINRRTGQIAITNVQNVSVGRDAALAGSALGNSVSSISETTATPAALNDSRVASVQINQNTLQLGVVNLERAGIAGKLGAEGQAVGNTGSFESKSNDISTTTWGRAAVSSVLASEGYSQAALVAGAYNEGFAFQANRDTLQVAGVNLRNLSVTGDTDAAATSVGNDLGFRAQDNASAVAFQINSNTAQLAGVNAQYGAFGGDAAFASQSLGNLSNWTGNSADGINFQSNLSTMQGSLTNIQFNGFSRNLTASSLSAGNVANIRSINIQ